MTGPLSDVKHDKNPKVTFDLNFNNNIVQLKLVLEEFYLFYTCIYA